MPATCHRVVGIVDVEENPELMLQLQAPLRANPFTASPSQFDLFASENLSAEIEQLAADLKIEYERYQRLSSAC